MNRTIVELKLILALMTTLGTFTMIKKILQSGYILIKAIVDLIGIWETKEKQKGNEK